MSSTNNTSDIFPPWHLSGWHAVDDRVRGGSSQSHLDAFPLDKVAGANVHGDDKRVGARFWGTLDTQTLGGAGFASQRYIFGPTPLSLPKLQYSGIALHLLPDPNLSDHSSKPINDGKMEEPHNFTLVLKTSPPQHPPSKPRLPPNPEPASLSYEHDFSLTSSSSLITGKKEVQLNFDDFKPVYRGRDVSRDDPRYIPFDPTAIFELSLMCRSGFGKQEGEFGVVVVSMEGIKKGRIGQERGRDDCWSGVSGWVKGLWGGERGVKL